MTRRRLLGTLAAVVAAAVYPFARATPRKRIGLITVNDIRAPHVKHVTVDGVDVIGRKCIAADDRHGWALCYAHAEDGRLIPNGRHEWPWWDGEIFVGDVEVTF